MPVSLGRSFANPLRGSRSPQSQILRDLDTDRILVLLQIKGGWDGLNIVVPITDQIYHDSRPNLRLSSSDVYSLNNEMGLRNELSDLLPLWGNGGMSILQGVGYPNSTLSHFEGTENWISASPHFDDRTGWIGRTLDLFYEDIEENPLEAPLAVEISSIASRLYFSSETNMGVTLRNPDEFYNIAQTGGVYDINDVPPGIHGDELSFVRSVANFSVQYSDRIQDAAQNGANQVSYPDSSLAEKLSIVARLIKGGLGSKVYTVQLDGFDTHGYQDQRLPLLLSELSSAVATFYQDLAITGHDQKTLTMTFSEFGRRVYENASNGTDHGTAAPIFLFGGNNVLNGGLLGNQPDLGDLDARGNLKVTTDFRNVYGTVLSEWLGVNCSAGSAILDHQISDLNLITNPDPGAAQCSLPVELSSFEADYLGNGEIMLSWTTDSELNNSGFEIEKLYLDSTQSQLWQKLGFVSGGGTKQEKSNYQFKAKVGETGNYRFRLKQVDFNGGFEYSQRIELFVDIPSQDLSLDFYPNPFKTRGIVQLKVNRQQLVKIDLYDQLGRVVKNVFHDLIQGNLSIDIAINSDQLANGTYLVHVSGEDIQATHKISLQR